jgi:cytochrome oxidase Cu insertion factor (SCO1/SenC/PrrC family)
MRSILAVAATALVVGVVTSTVVLAQKKTTDTPRTSRAQASASLNDSYNRCVTLARSRGYTSSDLDGNRASARNFVINCMKGKQH